MKRFFVICLSVLLICSLLLPVSPGNVVILNYEPWLFFYDLVDCDENYNIWLGMYSYGGSEELYPIHVDEDDYNAKLLASETPDEPVAEITDVIKPEPVEFDLSDGDSVSADIHSESDSGYLQAAALSPGSQSSLAQSPVMAVTTVPTSGQSYKLQRKYKCRVFLNSQSFDIDKKIRDVTDQMGLMVSIGNVFSVYRPIRRSITLTEPSAEAESRIADRLKFESLFKWQITYLPKYFKYFDSFAAPVRPPMPFTEVVADLTDNNVRRSMKRLGRRKDD